VVPGGEERGRLGSRRDGFQRQRQRRARVRPRGLQIRLVSGNACIIGTPTPSTTRPRASHGQVIMNRGPSRSRTRGRLDAEQRAAKKGRERYICICIYIYIYIHREREREKERANAQSCCSRLRAHPSRRPPSPEPPERRLLRRGLLPHLIDELY